MKRAQTAHKHITHQLPANNAFVSFHHPMTVTTSLIEDHYTHTHTLSLSLFLWFHGFLWCPQARHEYRFLVPNSALSSYLFSFLCQLKLYKSLVGRPSLFPSFHGRSSSSSSSSSSSISHFLYFQTCIYIKQDLSTNIKSNYETG